jgi:hypothetical protein
MANLTRRKIINICLTNRFFKNDFVSGCSGKAPEQLRLIGFPFRPGV